MNTLIIELTNSKAYKLLQDMEDLKLIRLLKKPARMSVLRHKIKSKMSNEEIDKQLQQLRAGWQRDF